MELDETDRKILKKLLKDARTPYEEIARELIISGGTVHVRINKMKEAGIITGSKIKIDFSLLGYEVTSFIGVNLTSAKDYGRALEKLKTFDEITDIYYTTGQYSLFIKVVTKSTKELHQFLLEKIQALKEIQSTETFISLDNPISRDPSVY